MDAKTKRRHLKDFEEAARQIELAGVCIDVLETMHGVAPQRCVKALKAEQQKQLLRLDKAAEKLGAPYGA